MITQEIVKELLIYDLETGIFTWRFRPAKWFKRNKDFLIWNKRFSGEIAGNINTHFKTGKSYRRILIFGKSYSQHRLAFLYVTGKLPDANKEIDHKDGDGTNNRWSNLRETDKQGNSRNRRLQSNNTSGQCGVSLDKRSNKFVAFIHDSNGKKISLGAFKTLYEAVIVRKSAEIEYTYSENHEEERKL